MGDAKKMLVLLDSLGDRTKAESIATDIVASYPDSLLVKASSHEVDQLKAAGLECAELETPNVQLSGVNFAFDAAEAADLAAPLKPVDPHRTNYYVLHAVGPILGDWLKQLTSMGATVFDSSSGFDLVIGSMPRAVPRIRDLPWVEGVTPYRAAMKVSAALRPGAPQSLDAIALNATDLHVGDANDKQQVQISVFPGESTVDVAAAIRGNGGVVLGEAKNVVTAVVPAPTVSLLAEKPGIQSIIPDSFPELHNNKAGVAIGAPDNRTFGTTVLKGTGQIIGVGDSGLDSGTQATLHEDIRGRVVDITSFATRSVFAPFTNDPASNDDGPADLHSAHGTHVVGSVLGNGAAAIAKGVAAIPLGLAPEASVYFQAVEQKVDWKSLAEMGVTNPPFGQTWPPAAASLWGLPDDLKDLFQPAYNAGARIHTNSWGNSRNDYTVQAQQVDDFCWRHRDFLALFSAGNSGLDNDQDGIIDPGSVGSPGTAKNCLTVGASENDRPGTSTPTPGLNANWSNIPKWFTLDSGSGHVSDDINGMAAFSSRGPTADDRIKPDVVAPGTNILSTRSAVFIGTKPLWGDLQAADTLFKLYCWSGGTSMSTPLVAGAAALVRQYLVEQRNHIQAGVKPSGALIKAFLVNGAGPIAGQFVGEIPGDRQNSVCGFGRVNLGDSIVPGLEQSLFDDEPAHAVSTGQVRTFKLAGVPTTRPLCVTLVWTDAPSSVGTGGLQNKLYLRVKRPDGTLVNGDVNPFPNPRNNVQRVRIVNPAAGDYEIQVRGISVTQQSPGAAASANPQQDFAIVTSSGSTLTVVP